MYYDNIPVLPGTGYCMHYHCDSFNHHPESKIGLPVVIITVLMVLVQANVEQIVASKVKFLDSQLVAVKHLQLR
jgi:hypothetical protein